ncbi:MAG: hypothetical protein OdinLCB4_005500 [Candidatus Odinarchaeum yellowstonii]|uniref:Phosphoglycolate phosphatase n=1 Tax=Odinarchaeota yellowstonii (strain LCB_4) TaxID=1841599 RepID=A0AAF0IAY4_ODILC|nr:MAG: hypothetical protein OdinLCB4_005500 [Candidatus Odinarchaeum yellowstonii]
MSEYWFLNSHNGNIIINLDAEFILKKLDAIVFDCDGVLLNTSKSYDSAIKKCVNFLFSNIFNCEKLDLISDKDILNIRNTGGFNNDWELTYAFILYYFFKLSVFLSKRAQINLPENTGVKDAINLLKNLRNMLNLSNIHHEKITLMKEYTLDEYISYLDVYGLKTARKVLYSWAENMSQINFMQQIEKYLCFQKSLDHDVVTRIFQEFYLGPLLTEFYNIETILDVKEGAITKETLNGDLKDYKKLLELGIKKFGIASSRPRKEAEYILRKYSVIPEMVNMDALIFLEDIKAEEERIEKQTGQKLSLEKPHPASILLSLKNIGEVKAAAFVGDTAADIYAANEAKKIFNTPIVSVGFTGQASDPHLLEKKFMSLKTDIIVPSISQLVLVIGDIKLKDGQEVLKKCEPLI